MTVPQVYTPDRSEALRVARPEAVDLPYIKGVGYTASPFDPRRRLGTGILAAFHPLLGSIMDREGEGVRTCSRIRFSHKVTKSQRKRAGRVPSSPA